MRNLALVAVTAVVALACSDGKSYMTSSDAEADGSVSAAIMRQAERAAMQKGGDAAPALAPAQPGKDPSQINPSSDPATAPSLIIRTGNASVEVSKLEPAIEAVHKLATSLGGYVANSSLQTGENQIRSATIELKFPVANFDKVVQGLKPIGDVESVNVMAEDVTEEFVDISARVANARKLEERLIALLANRTGKLEEVLAVERELARVREEIERYEGRVRFLKTRAAVSTFTVTVHEPRPILSGEPGDNPLLEALRSAWRNFVGFLTWLISSLGVLIPLGVLVYLGWLAYRRWGRHLRPKDGRDK